MANELNLSASQFIVLAIVLSIAVTVLWLKKSYFQLDIEPKTDTVTGKHHAQRRHTLRGLYSITRQVLQLERGTS
ncbi:hypothetical protein [Streptococcus thermophilus]|jgi:hypothetical protein|uniref:hypothetical protein n=1 Tax=Streptococcus thermophilus TaxID=1308 RepID=UPI001E5BC5B5|nr:hypothetical protein [Streptococcus thermophilus]